MNELLLVAEAVVCTLLVVVTWKFAQARLYAIITIFLILIANLGGKIIEVFGHVTNTGNIFYASVFLATYFLIERRGKREGIYSIWVAVIGVAFFFVLVQLTVAMVGSPATGTLNYALSTAYSPFSQITAASLIAYVLSQNLNVYLYIYLKEKFNGAHLWVRANASSVLAQIVDSIVFFTIAFWGVVPPSNIWDILITGFSIKVIFIAVTSPLLYLNKIEQEDGHDFSRISIR